MRKEQLFNSILEYSKKYSRGIELVEFLNIQVNEDDMNEQEKYRYILNKIIDCIVEIRYKNMKKGFQFSDIVKLNDYLNNRFSEINQINEFNFEYLANITKTDKIYIQNNIKEFYDTYQKNDYVDLNITSDFCNKLLNNHRSFFINEQRNNILNDLSNKMELSTKKKISILNGIKIKKASHLIADKKFEKLGITDFEFKNILETLKKDILNNKDIKKSGNIINEEGLCYLIDYFSINGNINSDIITKALNLNNQKIIDYIVNKFGRSLKKIADNIEEKNMILKIYEIKKRKIKGLNYNDYLIASKETIYKNILYILKNIDTTEIDKILNNKTILNEVLYLIVFADILPEISINKVINIFLHYDILREKLSINNSDLSKLSDLLIMSYSYSNIDDITLLALDIDNVSLLMNNISAYVNCYKMMLNRTTGNIPPIFLNYGEYTYESGRYSDSERLLIGKVPHIYSCIDLFNDTPSGTFKETLLEPTGDVILIRKNNKLISRIFIFRRGNIIQLATRAEENIDIKIYENIANQILENSINDNIDYIFVNKASFKNTSINSIQDNRFHTCFPHADLSSSAILIKSKYEDLSKIDFNTLPKKTYLKRRKLVDYNATAKDINHLKALKLFIENNNQKPLINFTPSYDVDYKQILCGEDWYLALKTNDEIEKIILPLDDRAYEEYNESLKILKFGRGK